jgi:hypothetical protein
MNFPAETQPDTTRVVFLNTTACPNKEKKKERKPPGAEQLGMQHFGSGSNCPVKFKRNSTA